MPAVILERAVDESEIVQVCTPTIPGAGDIPPAREVRGRQLNPDGVLVVVGHEVHILETQALDGRCGSIADRNSGRIGVIDKAFHDDVLDALVRARPAAIEGPGIVHGHGESVFDPDVTAGAEVVSIVMVLLLAVDDLYVACGEILAAEYVYGPVGGSQQQQILEGYVAAVVDQIAPDSISRIFYLSGFFSCESLRSVGLEVVPQPWVTLHIDGARPHQTRVLHIVKYDKSLRLPSPGLQGRRSIIGILAGAPKHCARSHVKLDVALHHHRACQVNALGKKEHAAPVPGGDVADGLIDLLGFHGLARTVNIVVLDVDHVRVAEFWWILLRRFGKQHQPSAVEAWVFVKKQDQIAGPIEFECDRIATDFRLDAIGDRPDLGGVYPSLADK